MQNSYLIFKLAQYRWYDLQTEGLPDCFVLRIIGFEYGPEPSLLYTARDITYFL